MKQLSLTLIIVSSVLIVFSLLRLLHKQDFKLQVNPKSNISYLGYFPSEDEFIDNSQLMVVRTDIEEDIVIVWNQGNQSLYQFDLQGKYIRTVTKRGHGPGEVLYVSGIALDNGYIVLNDQAKFMFHLYDYSGNFIRSVEYRETILMDIAYSHPFLIGQNALSISDDIKNEHSVAYIYNLENGELVSDVSLDLNHFNPNNRMVNLVATNQHFLLAPKAGKKVYKLEASSGKLKNVYEFSGYDFDNLRERLTNLFDFSSPNLIIDMVSDESGYLLAVNGTARKVLRMDSDFNLVDILRFEDSISFYENEYLRSISAAGNQLYILNGQGDGIIHIFNY